MNTRFVRTPALLAAVVLLVLVPVSAQLPGGAQITIESVTTGGAAADNGSLAPSISSDGRYVAFWSSAGNFAAGDGVLTADDFVRDRQAATTTRVTLSLDGPAQDTGSLAPAISGDGRYVAFESGSARLVSDDTNTYADVFVHDTQAGTTALVSRGHTGVGANGRSRMPKISGDGRYIVFYSEASNLVPDDTNGTWDVFVFDQVAGTTARASVGPAGAESNGMSLDAAISADGRYVTYKSLATNLVVGDVNAFPDVFVYDRQTGTTELVSRSSAGTQGDNWSEYPAISADGRYVAFTSWSSTLVDGDTNGRRDVFVHDRTTGATTRESVSSAGAQTTVDSGPPSISGDGRFVVFASEATNLVTPDLNPHDDIFLRDRVAGTTRLISLAPAGGPADLDSGDPVISEDGQYVAFSSWASNLVAGDANGNTPDIFVAGPLVPTTHTLSVTRSGTGGGLVTSSPAGIDCGATCAAAFDPGTEVVLDAAPDASSVFDGWSGDADCADGTVTMDADVGCTATFSAKPVLAVSLAGTGSGTVTSSPAGIDCGADCTEAYEPGTTVTLTATAAADSVFTGWTGHADCANGTLTMDGDRACTATFEAWRRLTVTKTGAGKGTVVSAPVGIDCGTDCWQDYAHGTVVTLTPAPLGTAVFAGWSGAPDCADGVITVDAAITCTARFEPGKWLKVLMTGSGTGVVTSSPGGITCPGDCTELIARGFAIGLTATPAGGSAFVRWKGAADCTDGALTMVGPRTCNAQFERLWTLTVDAVALNGAAGQVTSTPAGIDCSTAPFDAPAMSTGVCIAEYMNATVVKLRATPQTGSAFAGWSGACTHKRPVCTVPMKAAAAATATFTKPAGATVP